MPSLFTFLLVLTNIVVSVVSTHFSHNPTVEIIPSYRYRENHTFSLESFTELVVETELLLALTKHLFRTRRFAYLNQIATLLIELQGLLHSRKVQLRFCGNRHSKRPFLNRISNAYQIETNDPWVQRVDYKRLKSSVIQSNVLPPNTHINEDSLERYFSREIKDNLRQRKPIFNNPNYDNCGIGPYRSRLNKFIIKYCEELLAQRANELSNMKGLSNYYCVKKYTDNNINLIGYDMTIANAYEIFINLPDYTFKKNSFADHMGVE